ATANGKLVVSAMQLHPVPRPVAWDDAGGWIKPKLTAQTEFADQRLVALAVAALEVIEQLAPLVDHFQQTTAGMMIRLVGFEMGAQLRDAFGEQGHLHFR